MSDLILKNKELLTLVLVGHIEASLAGFYGERSTPTLSFCFHYFRNHRNFRSAVPIFPCCVFRIQALLAGGWETGGAWGCGERGICSQVVRDLPFIDSIFGGILKGFRKGRSVTKLLKKCEFQDVFTTSSSSQYCMGDVIIRGYNRIVKFQ